MFEGSKPKTGADLKADYENLSITEEPLAEGFLYKKKVHLIYAGTGDGKSTLAQQIAMELSAGKNVFKFLTVAQPFRVYYLQLEGDYGESIGRMRWMGKNIQPMFENLCWDVYSMNVGNIEHINELIGRIETAMPNPDLIVIDPIYQAIVGDLSKGEVAGIYCHFSSYLRNYFDCALLHIHHTPKDQFDQNGEKIERQTFYGSQWFGAHMNGMYYLKVTDKKNGKSVLYNKKQRNSNMLGEIHLNYDIETHSVYVESDPKNFSGKERVMIFLRECNKLGNKPSIYDIMDHCILSHAHTRRIIEQAENDGAINCSITTKGKKLYQLIG